MLFKISTTCPGTSTTPIKKSIFRGCMKLDFYLSHAIDHAYHLGLFTGKPLRHRVMMGYELKLRNFLIIYLRLMSSELMFVNLAIDSPNFETSSSPI
jgi:hypothetical protein